MNIIIDKSMDKLEELLGEKAILENTIGDFTEKMNLIEDRRIKCKDNLKTINVKIETELQIIEVIKLHEAGLIEDEEFKTKTEQLTKDLESFILRDKSENPDNSAS